MREKPTSLQLPSWYEAIANSPAVRLANSPAMQMIEKLDKMQPSYMKFMSHRLSSPAGCEDITLQETTSPVINLPRRIKVVNNYVLQHIIPERAPTKITPLSDKLYRVFWFIVQAVLGVFCALITAYFIYILKWN